MITRRVLVPALLVSWVAAFHVAAGDALAQWSQRVQPLLDLHCVKCHGPIEQKSGLELDTPEAVMKGGDEGAVVVPGKPEESRLFTYLAEHADPHMPPKKQLSAGEQLIVKEWILALPAAQPTPTAPAVSAPRSFESVPIAIDTLVVESWQRGNVVAAPSVEDRLWCRRVFLDVVGRIPTESEVAEFLAMPGDRRTTLADKLLSSAEYPVRMRELWDAILMGRPKRGNGEDRRKQSGWWTFLETAFRTNRPWNETVREMLVARPEHPDDKGATWFLYERKNEHQEIAEAVAPVIYGTRIDCAQCHDHPLAREIKQAHYWGLVAAFNRSKNVEGSNFLAESAVGGFMNFTNLKKESQPALVTLLTGKTLPENWPAGEQKEADSDDKYVDAKAKARVPKVSRREAFAVAATEENPLLASAFVNRMWSVLLGRGIVHPADEMNARNAPSHPELIEWLAKDFSSHRYDARRLIRGIILSRVYALAGGNAAPEAFAAAAERPLMAEQIARSWRIAAGLDLQDDASRKAVIGAMPDVLPSEYNATFQQAQFLTTAPALADLLKPASGSTVAKLAALPDAAARVDSAFVSVYGRAADPVEKEAAVAFLNQRPDKPVEAVRDLLWALLTSAEFLTMP